MEPRSICSEANRVAQLKLLVVRQQELAAEFARKGERENAGRARAKLLHLLNQLDLVEGQPLRHAS